MRTDVERADMTLVVFDFDGTLCRTDLAVLLGREYDVATEIEGLGEQGRRGDADFASTLRQRASLLEGMPEERVEAAFARCKLRDGAADLVADLRQSGVTVAVVTGSFEQGVETALERAGVAADHVVANRLVVENGAVTGAVEGPLLDAQKDRALEELAATTGNALQQTVVVGDGSTDLPMLRIAGTAIGLNPEPLVAEYCDVDVTSLHKLRLYLEQHGILDASATGA